jgi:hypothetical protein
VWPGALVAITYRSAVDDPGRFAKSQTVGAYFGLTPKKYQSGETDLDGGISRVGDTMVRTALYEAAHIMLTRATKFSTLKRWAVDGKAAWHETGESCAGPQACDDPSSHVDERERIPLEQGSLCGIDRRYRDEVILGSSQWSPVTGTRAWQGRK